MWKLTFRFLALCWGPGLAAATIPASPWNIAATLLSAENGQMIDVSVKPGGSETLQPAGEVIVASKFFSIPISASCFGAIMPCDS